MTDDSANRHWTVLDKLIGVFNPRAAARRVHFRRMASDEEYRKFIFALMGTRGYKSAKQYGTKTPWLGAGQSADAEILTDLPAMRNRSREINRDDSLGGGLTKTFVNNTIGTGMRGQARTGDPARNTVLETVYRERSDLLDPADRLNNAEGQRMRLRKVLEDGEIFRKRTKRDPEDPVWFETIEADRVATPANAKPTDEEGEIIDGVDKDRWGIPVGYWVRTRHPGDLRPGTVRVADIANFERVPASEMNHLKTTDRPGQTRGVPLFHAILQDMRDLDLLMVAALKRVQIAACLAIFLKSDYDIENILDVTAQKYGYRLDQNIEPGMIFKLFPHEDISTVIPNFPTPELAPFIIMLARRIGAALGVCWQVVLKDFSDSTFSSARTDLLESRQPYVVLQHWFAAKDLTWEWSSVLSDAQLRGDRRLAGIDYAGLRQVHWIANGWRWISPKDEALAIKTKWALRITCMRDEAAAEGKDWEELQDQWLAEEVRWNQRREALALDPAPYMPEAMIAVTSTEEAGGGDDGANNNGNRSVLLDQIGGRIGHDRDA